MHKMDTSVYTPFSDYGMTTWHHSHTKVIERTKRLSSAQSKFKPITKKIRLKRTRMACKLTNQWLTNDAQANMPVPFRALHAMRHFNIQVIQRVILVYTASSKNLYSLVSTHYGPGKLPSQANGMRVSWQFFTTNKAIIAN